MKDTWTLLRRGVVNDLPTLEQFISAVQRCSKSRHDSPSASLGPIPAFETCLTQASNEAILLHTIFLDLVETVTNYPPVK